MLKRPTYHRYAVAEFRLALPGWFPRRGPFLDDVLQRVRLHLAQPVQLLSDEEVERQRQPREICVARIRDALAERRARMEIPRILPRRPRVFVAVRQVNWELAALVEPWKAVAEIVHYDFGKEFNPRDRDWERRGRSAFGPALVERVREEHARSPIDIFFSYLSGQWVGPEAIRRIRELGMITVNCDFDDVYLFWGHRRAGHFSGSAEIAPEFDMCVSSQSEACVGKYVAIGAHPLFLPPGGNPAVFGPQPPREERPVGVSFIGSRYGRRARTISRMGRSGIPVVARGNGWPAGPVTQEGMVRLYQSSLVTLGFGFAADTGRVGIKGRDFEVPLSGCAYLTSYNPDLAACFEEDKEILFYRDEDDLIAQTKYCLAHPEEAKAIGLAGRERALREHTWEDRWRELINLCR
jgi:hypothetical protein